MDNYIIVFDLETDGLNVESEVNGVRDNINQIGAVAIDLKNLTIDKDNAFNVVVRPEDIDDDNYYEKHKGGIDFHIKWTGNTLEELVEKWSAGISEKLALEKLKAWISQYKKKEPLMFGGQNIRGFDMPICIERFNANKIKGCPFSYRGKPISAQRLWDLYDITPKWFMYSKEKPFKYSMDELRKFFSMGHDSAHDALQDVYDEAELIVRFLKFYQNISPRVQWSA